MNYGLTAFLKLLMTMYAMADLMKIESNKKASNTWLLASCSLDVERKSMTPIA
ncbi:hypothetical protein [Photobacterium sp.]|uniref:hypothetical protein n=1 Tax=Photobacterium sp. TaxID=660 RepID=UPI00299F19D6|nr:hypothetical protein [Photobacterium sp.]MDX1303543.1 hypothetical protein [Photobacterium sp.]